MNAPTGWPWLVLAAALIGLAVYAGPNQSVALASSAGALFLVAWFLLSRTLRARVAPARGSVVGRSDGASPFRASLAAGRSGRSEVVVLLDELDRRTAHPDRPMTPATEMVRLRGLSRPEFRAYVAGRLDEIEGSGA